MPIGNPGRDFENIVANVKEFENIEQSELFLVIDSPDCPEANALSRIYSESQNVTVLRGSWGNPGSARNFGKEKSSGEWISFIDSDDYIDFRNYYQMVLEGNSNGAELILGKYQVINENGIIVDSTEVISHHSLAKSIARNPGIWRLSFKRNLVDEIDFPGLRMAEDQVFLARSRFWEREIWISDFLVYTYRKNILGQLTRNQDAISDLLEAQEITLGLLFKERPNSAGSRILSVVFTNQLLTSLKHLGLRGFASLRKTFRKESGTIRLLRIGTRLGLTMLVEMVYKSKRLRKAGSNQ